MAYIYAIANQKGGVGKTTTAQALAAGLVKRRQRVLSVDLDHQGNLGFICGVDKTERGAGEALEDPSGKVRDLIVATPEAGDLLPAGNRLPFVVPSSKALARALKPVAAAYDYIIIDTAPTLSPLTIAALTAADGLIITVTASITALGGLSELMGTIRNIKAKTNPALRIEGILLTKHSGRAVVRRQMAGAAQGAAAAIGTKVFKAVIRDAVAIEEAQAVRRPLAAYAPKSPVAQDYEDFIDELLKNRHKEK